MKKIIALLLMLILMFSLCACGTETIELTPENIKEYLTIAKETSGGAIEESSAGTGTALDAFYKRCTSEGTVTLKAVPSTEAKFENVTMKIRMYLSKGRIDKEWEFATGGTYYKLYDDDEGTCYKDVTMVVSYDGEGSVSADAVLDVLRSSISHDILWELTSSASYEILDVSGTAIVPK